jgi:hypothetical protein
MIRGEGIEGDERRVIHILNLDARGEKRVQDVESWYMSGIGRGFRPDYHLDEFVTYRAITSDSVVNRSVVYGFGTLSQVTNFSERLKEEGISHTLHPMREFYNVLGKPSDTSSVAVMAL